MSETTTSHNGNQPLVILRALFRAMRPRQWPKNGFVFAALIFDGQLFSIDSFLRTVAAFVCFCAVSSAGYLINDLADIEKDRQHPTNRLRPLAAGILPPWVAVAAAAWAGGEERVPRGDRRPLRKAKCGVRPGGAACGGYDRDRPSPGHRGPELDGVRGAGQPPRPQVPARRRRPRGHIEPLRPWLRDISLQGTAGRTVSLSWQAAAPLM